LFHHLITTFFGKILNIKPLVMKKILLLLSVTMVSAVAFSQLSIGLQGTGSVTDAKIKTAADLNYKKKMKAMPGGGIVLQYGLNKHFAIRSGISYAQQGVSVTTTLDDISKMQVKLESRLHYVQVPLNFLYTVPLSRIQLYAGAGGYINYGIDGNMTATLTHTMPDGHQASSVEKTDAFKKEEDGGSGFKKTDWGLGGIAGIRFGKVFVNAGYQLSLSNIDVGQENQEYKNRSLQITIGYFFR
jgi:Outer membrane protein beta-barrel domain